MLLLLLATTTAVHRQETPTRTTNDSNDAAEATADQNNITVYTAFSFGDWHRWSVTCGAPRFMITKGGNITVTMGPNNVDVQYEMPDGSIAGLSSFESMSAPLPGGNTSFYIKFEDIDVASASTSDEISIEFDRTTNLPIAMMSKNSGGPFNFSVFLDDYYVANNGKTGKDFLQWQLSYSECEDFVNDVAEERLDSSDSDDFIPCFTLMDSESQLVYVMAIGTSNYTELADLLTSFKITIKSSAYVVQQDTFFSVRSPDTCP